MKTETATRKRRLYEFIQKNWWTNTIIVGLPTLLIFVVKLFGVEFDDFAGNTLFGKVIIGFIILLYVAGLIFVSLKAKYDIDNYDRIQTDYYRKQFQVYQGSIKDSTSMIADAINANKESYSNIARMTTTNPFANISSRLHPVYTIKNHLITAIQEILDSPPFKISKDKLHICLFLKPPWEEDSWISILNRSDSNSNKKCITDSPHSTFHYAYIEKAYKYIFYLDKENAIKENKYLNLTGDTPCKGSIYCRNISFRYNDNVLLPAVICIETEGIPFYTGKSPDGTDIEYKQMITSTFESFEEAIRLELARLYVNHITGISGNNDVK